MTGRQIMFIGLKASGLLGLAVLLAACSSFRYAETEAVYKLPAGADGYGLSELSIQTDGGIELANDLARREIQTLGFNLKLPISVGATETSKYRLNIVIRSHKLIRNIETFHDVTAELRIVDAANNSVYAAAINQEASTGADSAYEQHELFRRLLEKFAQVHERSHAK